MKSWVLKHVSLINYCIWQGNPSQIDLMLSSRSFGNSVRVSSPCWWLLLGPSEVPGWLSLPAGGTQWLGAHSGWVQLYFHGGREGLPKQKAWRDHSERLVSRHWFVAVEHPWFKRGISSPPSLTALEHTELLFIIPHPLWENTS